MPFFAENLKRVLENFPFSAPQGVVCEVDSALFALAATRSATEVTERSCLVLADSVVQAERICADMQAWLELAGIDRPVELLPELEVAQRQIVPEHECERSRIFNLTHEPGRVYVASVMAAVAPAPAPETFREAYIQLEIGSMDWPPQKLAESLIDLDYDNEVEVRLPGEFSWRGGILDIFSPVYEYPVRLDYFGDELESLRFFDPESQRSIEATDTCLIIPRGERAMQRDQDVDIAFADYFKASDLSVVLCEPEQIAKHLETYAAEDWLERYNRLGDGRHPLLILDEAADTSAVHPRVHPTGELFVALKDEFGENAELLRKQLLWRTLERWLSDDYRVGICCSSQSKLDRVKEWIAENEALREKEIAKAISAAGNGLIAPDDKVVMLTENEIFGVSRPPTRRRKHNAFRADHMLHGSSDLQEGNYAVHALYGICRYNGLGMKTFNGELQEVLVLEFADDVEVYVPLEQAHLVSRYIGAGKKLPKLSRVGHGRWKRVRAEAEDAVKDMAAELLRIQAMRTTCEGFSFSHDEASMDAFIDAFPYEETEDQVKSTDEILADMERSRPMDRLLCGDVGFGKTEVAMRAAFKAILDGKQIAVLVPTTVLCQQHYFSFRERFKEFPVLIDELSRFRSSKEQRQVLKALEQGTVDIVIGTHRLLSTDVKFKDLGLLIIDEEQRFGVEAKEQLKQLRTNVDVLTMTATPIPRTLYLSMSGLRDMSTIITPPLERLPVQTIVSEYSEELIREAILREIQRDGQVFLLHNRVKTIEGFARHIQTLVPEADIDIGHGQMDEHELEDVMLRFIEGKTNVLVCTTIIESGLDIPNANTIIIDRADRFGLAELYQLRGRVGRYHRQAYAYLLIPPHGMLISSARQRLSAIRKYTQLGAGFKLALRDLEIRGAGNILGREQSGHIAAIGFDLYCQLLREAVARLKGESAQRRRYVSLITDFIGFGEEAGEGRVAACLPRSYIHDEGVRVECYRRLSSITEVEAIDRYREELIDRFGALPEEAENFLAIIRMKVQSAAAGIHSIVIRDQKLLAETSGGFLKERNRIPRLHATEPGDKLQELCAIVERLTEF